MIKKQYKVNFIGILPPIDLLHQQWLLVLDLYQTRMRLLLHLMSSYSIE